jgi:hypothetical protein
MARANTASLTGISATVSPLSAFLLGEKARNDHRRFTLLIRTAVVS